MNFAETELCGICFTSELGEEACARFSSCGHIFHANCVKMLLSHRWTTLRITFGFLDCPSCKQEISIEYFVPQLTEQLSTALAFRKYILSLAVKKVIEEGLDKEGRVVTEGDIYYNDVPGFAMHNVAFYECFKCKEAYFGGMQDCGEAMETENTL